MNAPSSLTLALALALAACATWQPPAEFSDAALRSRAVTRDNQGLRVSAAVLSREESRRMFGIDLDHSQMQPVWVEVHNATPRLMWLLRTGTDPDYFSPLEVAWSAHTPLDRSGNASIDRHFEQLGFRNPIPPGGTRAGMLFTNPERRTKLLNIDLLGQKTLVPFSLFLPVPDNDAASAASAPQTDLHAASLQAVNYRDLAELRGAIERLPCCARSRGTAGDPLNVVVVGELEDIGAAMVRRNYRRDARTADLAQQVFGRGPDEVLRKQAQPRSSAAWIRVWRAPLSFEGRPVYLAQAGRPVGGRFAAPDPAEVRTHPDVDEARNVFIQDMMYSGGLDKLGFALGSAGERGDGLRAVLFFATRPLNLSEVEILEWVPFTRR